MSIATRPVDYDSRHSLIGHCPLTDQLVRTTFANAIVDGRYDEAALIAATHRDKLEDEPVVLEGVDAVRFQALLGQLAVHAPQIPPTVLAHA